jgi:hypothetical protein
MIASRCPFQLLTYEHMNTSMNDIEVTISDILVIPTCVPSSAECVNFVGLPKDLSLSGSEEA